MKEKRATMDKVTALDAAIENERQTIERLQASCQQLREEARRAAEQQTMLAYKALGEGEAQAQAGLAEAEETLARSDARAKSADIALKAAQDKLESLRQEREHAFRDKKRTEYEQEVKELLKTDAEQLEQALVGMAAARDSVRERLRKMEGLAVQAGMDVTRTHNKVRDNLRHAIEQKAQFDSVMDAERNTGNFPVPRTANFGTNIQRYH
jgi:chromosome segregation ATPase